MSKYIDEYLVALGFDLNSEQGKEYIKMCDDIEERNKQLEKSGKSVSDQAQKNTEAQQAAVNGNRQQNDSENQLYESRKRRKRAPQEAPQKATPEPVSTPAEPVPSPTEAPTEEETPQPEPTTTYQAPKQPQKQPKAPKEPAKQPTTPPTPQNTVKGLSQSFRQLGNAWSQFQRGNIFSAFEQGASSVRSFRNYVDNLTPGFANANTKASAFGKTLQGIFGGKAVKTAAQTLTGAGEEATSAGESAAELSSGAGAAAALGVAGVIVGTTTAIWNMSDGLAQAGINAETMARKLWISDSAALQLDNTLAAMGKTQADLNEIAINPILSEQFKELQQTSKGLNTEAIEKSTKQWAEGPQLQMQQMNAKAEIAKNSIKANLENTFAPLFEKALGAQSWAQDRLLDVLGAKPNNTTNNTTSTYAPQNYSYTTSSQGGTVNNTQHIEVHADSNSAQDIGKATASAAQEAFNNAALLKNVQGMYR